jgi:hypothetical protein
MPDLLFLTQRLPYPPIKGEKIRPLQILKYLVQRYDVHLGCLIDDVSDAQHVDTIRSICRDVHVAPLEIAAACCRLATSADGVAIGAAARTRIVRDYDWSARLRRFDDLLRPVPAARVADAV